MSDVPPSDEGIAPPPEPSTPFEENVKRRSTWMRLVFMIVLWLLYQVAEFVAGVVIVIQFLWVLFTGKKNPGLLEFGQSISTYIYEVLRYLTFNTEERPFPFDLRWPGEPP
ncbi:MAG TPA: DUF4389 domain-containing protein [Gammaproteobacteria bacterium]|nr:DUF4389 domain-containing protein [Gammaproteobacteria bacterium]